MDELFANWTETDRAIIGYESLVRDIMLQHGVDYATAIEWDMEIMETNDVRDYEIARGLPGHYVRDALELATA